MLGGLPSGPGYGLSRTFLLTRILSVDKNRIRILILLPDLGSPASNQLLRTESMCLEKTS